MRGLTMRPGQRVVIVVDTLRGVAGTVSGVCGEGGLEVQMDRPIESPDAGTSYVMTFHESQVVPEAEWCTCDLRSSGCTCGAFAAEKARKEAALAMAS